MKLFQHKCKLCNDVMLYSLSDAGYGDVYCDQQGTNWWNAIEAKQVPSLLEQMGKNPLLSIREHGRRAVSRIETEINENRAGRGEQPLVWND